MSEEKEKVEQFLQKFDAQQSRSSLSSFARAARLAEALLPGVHVTIIMPKYGMVWSARGPEGELSAPLRLADRVTETGALTWVADASAVAEIADFPLVKAAPFLRGLIGAPIRFADAVTHGVLCITSPEVLPLDPDTAARIQDIAELLADIWFHARNDRLARADHLAGMSHQVRTLLNGVIGMAQVLDEPNLTQAQKDGLRIVRQSGESLLGLLSDFPNADSETSAPEPAPPKAKVEVEVEVEAVAASPEAPASPETGSLRILAAEDNVTNQMVLKALLDQAGLPPVIVNDGAEALAAWRDQEWDVILMDVQMPVMDGPAATRTIRELERTEGRARTPIIALTANTLVHQITEYTAIGMDDVVPKPIQIDRLLSSINAALAHKDAAPQPAASADPKRPVGGAWPSFNFQKLMREKARA